MKISLHILTGILSTAVYIENTWKIKQLSSAFLVK